MHTDEADRAKNQIPENGADNGALENGADNADQVEGSDEGDICVSEGSTVVLEKNDRSVRELFTWFQDHELDLHPDWQRHYVWDYKRASTLIESIFMGRAASAYEALDPPRGGPGS